MKTHDLAYALEQLAGLLRSSPNTELADVRSLMHPSPLTDSRKIAVNLSTLAALSHLDRQQWLSFVKEYGLPIAVRPRDASRDILGKLLRYLEENPNARRQLRDRAQHREATASPELMKALNILLNDDEEQAP